jgi:hypothetical protein
MRPGTTGETTSARLIDELLELGLVLEAGDGPCFGSSGPPHGFESMVAIFDRELVVTVGDDDRWRSLTILDLVGEVVDVVAPVVILDDLQDRRAGRPG